MKRLLGISVAVLFVLAGFTASAQDKAKAKAPASAEKVLTATGTVSAVASQSLTIKAASGEMTFAIDNKTAVTGKGLGTKNAALKDEGKTRAITEFVHVGDSVDVKYHDMGATKHASTVRVVTAAVKK